MHQGDINEPLNFIRQIKFQDRLTCFTYRYSWAEKYSCHFLQRSIY